MRNLQNKYIILITLLSAFLCLTSGNLLAADEIISGNITGDQGFNSEEATFIDGAVFKLGSDVLVTSRYEVVIKPGTRVETGAKLHVIVKDDDGLSNRWEDLYFSDLYAQGPSHDSDSDGMTNFEEYLLNLDPTDGIADTDADGMPDWWEIEHFGNTLSHDPNIDDDGDGVSNRIEYMVRTNPMLVDLEGPGLHYEYDALGRLKRITRIPAQ